MSHPKASISGENLGQPASITEVTSGTSDAQGVAATANLRLIGFSCRENAGSPAAAEFILRHGTADTAPAIAFVKLAASGSVTQWLGFGGIGCPNGIFVDRVSGTTHISLWTTVEPST